MVGHIRPGDWEVGRVEQWQIEPMLERISRVASGQVFQNFKVLAEILTIDHTTTDVIVIGAGGDCSDFLPLVEIDLAEHIKKQIDWRPDADREDVELLTRWVGDWASYLEAQAAELRRFAEQKIKAAAEATLPDSGPAVPPITVGGVPLAKQ